MKDFNNEYEMSHNTKKSYIIGFVLSIVLTITPFWIVMHGSASHHYALGIIVLCAIIQVLIHVIYFLHLNRKVEGGWSIAAVIFSLIIILIIVIGSLWIMWHLNNNMIIYS